jgi:tRNA pseudouridine55 synthase
MSAGPHGILLVDKPAGWTSHDVVAKARRLCSQRKIGHTGTLDPMATGLLILCLGDATRLVEYMTQHDKRYEGEIVLGARTDTDDAEGTVVEQRLVPGLDGAQLREIERRFTGQILQRPPAYSAIKIAGQRAYAAARRGKDLDLLARPVTVHEIHLSPTHGAHVRILVSCGAGTYIRSLARDIGEVVGCGAHLGSLRRTQAGGFSVEEAITLEKLAAVSAAGLIEDVLRAPDEGVIGWPAGLIGQDNRDRFLHGSRLEIAFERPPGAGPIRIYDTHGSFLGVASATPDGGLKARKVLSSAQIA